MSPRTTIASRVSRGARDSLLLYVQVPLIFGFANVAAIASQANDPATLAYVLTVGAALTVVSLASFFVPWKRFHRNWQLILPVVDMGFVALLRGALVEQQPRVSTLVLFPVLWLAFSFGILAVCIALVGNVVVALFPSMASGTWPSTTTEWGNTFLPLSTLTLVTVAVYIVARRVRKQQFALVEAYEALRVSVAKGVVGDEALRVSVAKGVVGDEALRVSVAKGVVGDEALRVSVAKGVVGDEALRVSVAEGVDDREALRVSVAEGIDDREALRVSVAEGIDDREALRVSVAEGVDDREALRVSVAEGVDDREALRVSVAEGLDSAEALRLSVAEGVDSAEALRISVAENVDSAEALRVSVAEGVDDREALRVSVAEGLDSAEALRVSVAEGVDSAEALRVAEAAGVDDREKLRVSVAQGLASSAALRRSVAQGLESAQALRVSVAQGLDDAEALRVSVAQELDVAEALRVSIAEGLDAASAALAVVDTVDAGITFYDPNGVIVLTNDTARALAVAAGASAAPLLTQAPLVFEGDRVTPIPAIDQIVGRAARGELVTRRAYWVGAGAEQRALVASSQYVRRASGEVIGTVVATHDVTQLADAIQSRDEFLTTVSHELRTPLTSVLGYLEMIEDSIDIPNSTVAHEFDVVQRNSHRLLALINDLLTTAEGQAQLERRSFNIAELVEKSLTSIRGRAAELDITVDTPVLLPVRAEVDADRIGDVLDKLLSNAVKFNQPGGGVSVTVNHDGHDVIIRIADTGTGMSAEDLPHIFERFYRSSTARTGQVAGAGLGLSTAKIIVDAHHGTITAVSALGVGTTMELRLPLVVADPDSGSMQRIARN